MKVAADELTRRNALLIQFSFFSDGKALLSHQSSDRNGSSISKEELALSSHDAVTDTAFC